MSLQLCLALLLALFPPPSVRAGPIATSVPGVSVRIGQAAGAPASQQTGDATAALREAIAQAFALFDADQVAEADRGFAAALERAIAIGDRLSEAEARRGLGLVRYERAQYAGARDELDQALRLFESLGDKTGEARVRRHLGSVLLLMGDKAAAVTAYESAQAAFLELGARGDEARTLLSLSYAKGGEESLRLVEAALAIARELGDRKMEGRALHLIGDRLFAQGDFDVALQRLEEAAAAFEATGARADVARVYTSLGRINRAHGHPDVALDWYRRGLAIQQDIGDQQGAIQSINAMAVAYGHLGKTREALEHYERALALARDTGSRRIINFQLGNTGLAYLNGGDATRAVAALTEAIASEPDSSNAAYWNLNLSLSFEELGDLPRALDAAVRAVAVGRTTGMNELLPQTLLRRASVLRRLDRPGEALADARDAIAAVEDLRRRLVPNDFMKRGFAESYQGAFALVIDLLHELGRSVEAFDVAEQARARAFLDLIATRDIRLTAGSSQRLSATSLLATRGPGGLPRSESERESALESTVHAVPMTAREMAETAGRLDSTVVSYWVASDAVLIWVIRPDGRVDAARTPISSDDLAALASSTLDIGPSPRPRGQARPQEPAAPGPTGEISAPPREAWRRLHDVLVAPIRSYLPARDGARLTIIPHGALFRLSFAALLDDRGVYLTERYVIHYAPAGAALRLVGETARARTDGPPAYLFVADPRPLPRSSGTPLAPLPGAVREARAIAAALPLARLTMLTGARATESVVVAALAGKSVVHFATHALLNDAEPLDSFLALGASSTDPAGDGRLTVAELYGVTLDADLIVLAACQTAGGQVSGDGIAGFSRALFYAGTPSVLATIWEVADEPSRLLMQEFYRQWHGRSKDEALRLAELRLLRDLRAGRVTIATPAGRVRLPEHPFFWAGFVLLGEP